MQLVPDCPRRLFLKSHNLLALQSTCSTVDIRNLISWICNIYFMSFRL